MELAVTFSAWKNAIGDAAYRSWLRGGDAWIGTDNAIHIKVGTECKANWIRRKYVNILEMVAAMSVIVHGPHGNAVQHWPCSSDFPAPTAEDVRNAVAWWQTNPRWPGDTNGV
jgi:hypothetical protein